MLKLSASSFSDRLGRVTITATWLASDRDLGSRLYMASDSRISGADGRLMDEGVKLFQLPVRVFSQGSLPGPVGTPVHETSIGVVCAGSTLVFQQTYAALVALFSQIQCVTPHLVLPTVGELADYMARVLTRYYRSLGSNRPDPGPVSMIVGGIDPISRSPVAFELERGLDSEGVYKFVPHELTLTIGVVDFRGDADACARASELWNERVAEPNAASYNDVLRIVESLAADSIHVGVGGSTQVGYTNPFGFHRVARATLSEGDIPEIYLHGLPLLGLGAIGSNLMPTLGALA